MHLEKNLSLERTERNTYDTESNRALTVELGLTCDGGFLQILPHQSRLGARSSAAVRTHGPRLEIGLHEIDKCACKCNRRILCGNQ